jgi:hypothetical protein
VRAIDPEQPVLIVQTLDEWWRSRWGSVRLAMLLLSAFAALALLLATVGIYSVLAYTGAAARARDRHPHGARRAGQGLLGMIVSRA